MEPEIKKRVCLVYDTFQDMIKDPDIIADMVVMTLGFECVDDGEGGIYKIILKGTNNTRNLNGGSFGPKSQYFAKLISMQDVVSLRQNLLETRQLIKGLENALNAAVVPGNIDMNDVYHGINQTINTSNKQFQEFYLDEENDIKIVQTFEGLRYIIHKNRNSAIFTKEVEITEENSWLIPTEFIITDYFVNSKDIHCGNIHYENNKLIFNLDFSEARPFVIPY